MALTGAYTVNCELDTLSGELSAMLRESFGGDVISPTVLEDQTCFSGRDGHYQTDTYQIYSVMERGYLTVNIHFFQPSPESALSVKTAVLLPVNDTSRKARKILAALEAVILGHSTT